jgi:hypothetical protein
MRIELMRITKRTVTRLFVAGIAAVAAGLVLAAAALAAALASDAIDVGGSDVIAVNGGAGAWTALGLVLVASVAVAGGGIAAVASWIGALLNTVQLENKSWFASLLVLGLLGLGFAAMIAYVVAGPDGMSDDPSLAHSRPIAQHEIGAA